MVGAAALMSLSQVTAGGRFRLPASGTELTAGGRCNPPASGTVTFFFAELSRRNYRWQYWVAGKTLKFIRNLTAKIYSMKVRCTP